MKRFLAIFILINVMVFSAFGQVQPVIQRPSVPVTPYIAGQGGSFTANAQGYHSMFKNPAGFAIGDGDITLLSTNVWGFADQSFIEFVQNPEAYLANTQSELAAAADSLTPEKLEEWAESKTEAELIGMLKDAGYDVPEFTSEAEALAYFQTQAESIGDVMSDPENASIPPEAINLANLVVKDVTGVDVMPSGDIRMGANMGLGIVKGGFGFGINLNADAGLRGATIMAAEGAMDLTVTGTLGYSFEIIEDFLYIGADLKPMYRVHVPVTGAQAMSILQNSGDMMAAMNTFPAYAGYGIGIDAGTIIKLGGLKLGLAVTDILNTRLQYTATNMGNVVQSLSAFSLPEGTDANGVYIIPMDVLLGVSYDLNLLDIINLNVHAEVSNVLSGIQALEQNGEFDVLKVIHAGANLSLFNFIGVMAGYNEGYVSGGASIRLLFLDVAASAFVKANGESVGYSDYGAALELAVRF